MKVLLIDDERNIVEIIKKYLIQENYEVLTAGNGLEGLSLFRKENPDFVLLDIMLPDLDGFSICQEIRKISNVPIIILTAKRHIEDKLIGLRLGADDYISKPFNPKELIARIQTILRRIAMNTYLYSKNNYAVTKGKLYLDKNNMQFYLDSQTLELTASEFRLLYVLYNNPDKIFNRDELLNNINGDNYSIDRSIDVHIRNLRKKLNDDIKKPNYIKTIWGLGYKYVGK